MKRPQTILLSILAVTFCASSMAKSINIPAFALEIDMYAESYLPQCFWQNGTEFAILVCMVEYFLGLITFSFKYNRIVAIGYVALSSIFLLLTFINCFMPSDYFGSVETCGCFGELIHFTAYGAFLKSFFIWCLAIIVISTFFSKGWWRELAGEMLCVIRDHRLYVTLLLSILPALFSIIALNRLSEMAYVLVFAVLCASTFTISYINQLRSR